MFRVLAIDGGGIRGIIPAIWLKALQKQLPEPLWNYFDLVAGTSTGSILAALLACDLDLELAITLYRSEGRRIFPPTARERQRGMWNLGFLDGISRPKYKVEPLADELQKAFTGHAVLSSAKTKLLITSYNVFARQVFLLKSYESESEDIKIWEACKASCSAPVYFPAHVIQSGYAEVPLIDGGIVANNPAALALAEAVRLQHADSLQDVSHDIYVASFGTGSLTRPISLAEATTWGGIDWLLPIVDVLCDAAAESACFICRQMLRDDNYDRLQVELHGASDDLDDASEENINNLAAVAEAHLHSPHGEATIHRIAKKLIEDVVRQPNRLQA